MHDELISRLLSQSKIDAIQQEPGICYITMECVEALKEIAIEAADAIEELQKAENFHKFNSEFWEDKYNSLADEKWISVTERLPEKEDEAVIVWEKQGFALIDWRHDNKWAILDNNYGIATHWMPLPKPPKDGEA